MAWYQWNQKNTKILSWEEFLQSLQVRFGPSELEDYQGKLTKLVQTGSVLKYQEEFEKLSNKVDVLSESFRLSCFVSGLKPKIQPTSLTKARALAKIQEQKLQLKFTPAKLFSPYPPILPTPPSNQPFTPSTMTKPVHTTTSNL